MSRVLQAAEFAARAHSRQTRKGGEVPYVNHVIEVARLVAENGQGVDAVTAALLHDVVEDTETELAEIGARFGPVVMRLVHELTDEPAWEELPRAARKSRQAEHIAYAPAETQAIKIADQTSNVRDVGRIPKGWEPGEAAAYVAETGPVVEACRAAAPDLAAIYDAAVRDAQDHIGKEART